MKRKQKSLVLLKPECYEWGIAEEIKEVLQNKGYMIESQKEVIIDMKIMQIFLLHYQKVIDRLGADFVWKMFNSYYFNGPQKICVMSISYEKDIIHDLRKLVGSTVPIEAEKGSIRACFSSDSYEKAEHEHRLIQNCIHASDSLESAAYELELWKDHL